MYSNLKKDRSSNALRLGSQSQEELESQCWRKLLQLHGDQNIQESEVYNRSLTDWSFCGQIKDEVYGKYTSLKRFSAGSSRQWSAESIDAADGMNYIYAEQWTLEWNKSVLRLMRLGHCWCLSNRTRKIIGLEVSKELILSISHSQNNSVS